MAWKFDPMTVDLIWVETTDMLVQSGSIDMGNSVLGDISIDTGSRTNDTSIVDSGLRVVNGSI